jgi:hypothetical protein
MGLLFSCVDRPSTLLTVLMCEARMAGTVSVKLDRGQGGTNVPSQYQQVHSLYTSP